MDSHLAAMQRALDYIEERLREPLELEAIARVAGFSLWHCQRIFVAIIGEPMGTYVRRRRLTAAAGELRNSSRRILDVALDYQFESNESFTRAFKSVFHVLPSEFRDSRQLPWVNTRPQLSLDHLLHLARNIMEPQIIESAPLTLVGLEARFISAMSPEANNMKIIPPLFQKFFARRSEIGAALDGFTYGACTCLPAGQRTRDDELVYMVSAQVAPDTTPPAGMAKWQLPAMTYAHFVHRGPIHKLNQTINYIYGAWLPRSDFERVDGPELERYDDRFGDGGEKSELDYLIPVKRR